MKKTGLSTALLLVFATAGAQGTSPTDSLLCRVYEDDQEVRRELHAYSAGVPQDSLMVIVARMLEIDRKINGQYSGFSTIAVGRKDFRRMPTRQFFRS